MARILIDKEWFEEISVKALYESEFETILLGQALSLFPGYFLVPFKRTVLSEDGSARADFALIETQYREWWVVEVELADHSLNYHVLPQVRTLSRARYSEPEAKYLSEKNADLIYERLLDMMKGSQPRVLVIVNSHKADWANSLLAHDAKLMVIEIYRSMLNKHAFWIKGGRLSELADLLSTCHFDGMLPRFLAIDSPSALDVRHNESIEVMFEETFTTWTRVDISNKVWLTTKAPCPLPEDKHFELVRLADGSLLFKIKD